MAAVAGLAVKVECNVPSALFTLVAYDAEGELIGTAEGGGEGQYLRIETQKAAIAKAFLFPQGIMKDQDAFALTGLCTNQMALSDPAANSIAFSQMKIEGGFIGAGGGR